MSRASSLPPTVYAEPAAMRRRSSLARIEQALQRRSGAVITGAAGIGKSHVARAVAQRLRARGVAVDIILATEAASTVPFGALAGLLEINGNGPGDLLEVLRGTGARLARDARAGGLVLIVDDAHLLDPASAALLLQIVSRHGIPVLATVRAGAPAPDAVTSLWKDAGLERITLRPLGEAATAEVARRLLGGPIERGTQRWLRETSAGNPLFLQELVRAGQDDESLIFEHGHWRRGRVVAPPAHLLELLGERIETLDADERRALALVVLAEPAALSLLERLDALDGARRLEDRGLLAAADTATGAALRVGHPLYGEALRAALHATEARELHAELAAVLAPAVNGTGLRLTTWALEDGAPIDAGRLVAATEQALAAFDPELAIRLGEAALAAAPGIAAALPLAVALRSVGRFEEAERHLAAFEEQLPEVATGTMTAASYLFVRATNLHWGLGRGDDALALLRRVPESAASMAVTAALLSVQMRLRDAVTSAERALALPGGDTLARSIAAVVIGHDLSVLGEPRRALAIVDEVGRTAGDIESELPRASVAVVAALYAGEEWVPRRLALAERRVAARAAGDDARAAMCEMVLSGIALLMGDIEEARRQAEDALTRLAFMDPRGMAPVCHAAVAQALAVGGRLEAAQAALARAETLLERGTAPPLTQALVFPVRVLLQAMAGDPTGGQELCLHAADEAGEAVLVEAELRHLFMRIGGDPGRVAERLTEIAATTQSTMAVLWARQARAARDGDAPGLEAVADAFERLGARLYAVEAAAQAAVAHGRTSDGAARRRAEGRCGRLAMECGAHGLILVATMRMSALTTRERETALLVRRGMSNAQIAEHLSLSVRTVESHIFRATTKLGLNDRASLGAWVAGRTGARTMR